MIGKKRVIEEDLNHAIEDIQKWRYRVSYNIMLILAIVSVGGAIIQFLFLSYTPNLAEHLFVWGITGGFLVIMLIRKIPIKVQVFLGMIFIYSGTVKQLFMHGFVSTSMITLILMPIAIFILMGHKLGIFSIVCSISIFSFFAILVYFQKLEGLFYVRQDPLDFRVWVEIGVEFILGLILMTLLLIRFNNLILHSVNHIREKLREVESSREATVFAMAKIAEYRDTETGAHLQRVSRICRILAEELAKNDKYKDKITPEYIDNLSQASILHDIGKVGIPDKLLFKTTELSSEQYQQMQAHTEIGARELKSIQQRYPGNKLIDMGIEIAEYHHERWDGFGYPYGLKGEDIPLSARIVALADVYDALNSERPYKEAYPHQNCIDIIAKEKGRHFDPLILDCFLKQEKAIQKVLKKENLD